MQFPYRTLLTSTQTLSMAMIGYNGLEFTELQECVVQLSM